MNAFFPLPIAKAAAAALLLTAASFAQGPPTYTIQTVAGTGVSGFEGDSGPATSAKLNNPVQVAVDSSGNLIIADQVNHRVRRIGTDGTISTIAGDGTPGFKGDGSPATAAGLFNPCGVVVDGSGNIYLADTHDQAVRKFTAGGSISTIAGTAAAGYTGDGAAAKDATVNTPIGLALDASGNLYIADSFNHAIRKIDTAGNITTVAGSGIAGSLGDEGAARDARLNTPQGVAVDRAGNIYIADTVGARIRMVTTDGIIHTIAGTGTPGFSGDRGPAVNARLFYPKGITVDEAGNVYFADSFNSRIRVIMGGNIYTIAGNGTFGAAGDGDVANRAQLRFPSGVTLGPQGSIYIADTQNSKIRVLVPVVPPVDSDAAAPSVSEE
jgi:sugar lactone lactonase YvrE